MSDSPKLSRRQFLKGGAAGLSLVVTPFSAWAGSLHTPKATDFDLQPQQPGRWSKGPGKARWRIEGQAKVTGRKLYGRDFRSRDVPGWPDTEVVGYTVHTLKADRIVTGVDFSQLPEHLRPYKVITSADFDRDHLSVPHYYHPNLFARIGETPDYAGQIVAIALFKDPFSFYEAYEILGPRPEIVTYGKVTGEIEYDPYSQHRIVRVEGEGGPLDEDKFSQVKDGVIFPPWKPADQNGDSNARATWWGEQIDKTIAENSDWKLYTKEFFSQSVDCMFMEPEGGLAWYDKDKQRLEFVISTQSGGGDMNYASEMFHDPNCAFPLHELEVKACYPGGGFGGRDHSVFSMFLILAGLYADGRPVRMHFDRFQQFQHGIKRHAAKIKYELAVDAKTGLFQALKTDLTYYGGGKNNFSWVVDLVGASMSTGPYYVPMTDLQSRNLHTIDPVAGSMRGFGTVQSMAGLESLVDEVANDLGMDHMDLSLKNLLRTGWHQNSGAVPYGAMRTHELVEKAKRDPLWVNRAADQKKRSDNQKLYGVGVGVVMKNFAIKHDAHLASLALAPNGQLSLKVNGIDMGNGSATMLALVPARWTGMHADQIDMGETSYFNILGLKEQPEFVSQEKQDQLAKDPRWTPLVNSGSSASTGAFLMSHVVREASRVLFEQTLWPLALELWSTGPLGGQSAMVNPSITDARWVDGKLTCQGLEPLPLALLAKLAHERGMIVSAMTHSYFRVSWTQSRFQFGDAIADYDLDALAVQYGQGQSRPDDAPWTLLDRLSLKAPPVANFRVGEALFSPCVTIAAIEISRADGKVSVVDTSTYLECGKVLVSEIVEGQTEGAVVMGIGHALSEYLPLGEGGAGAGGWNLNRYQVPRAPDVPLYPKLEILPPLTELDPAKGMAEVVMIPVIPAIINAVYHATGHRFDALPIRADQIVEVIK